MHNRVFAREEHGGRIFSLENESWLEYAQFPSQVHSVLAFAIGQDSRCLILYTEQEGVSLQVGIWDLDQDTFQTVPIPSAE